MARTYKEDLDGLPVGATHNWALLKQFEELVKPYAPSDAYFRWSAEDSRGTGLGCGRFRLCAGRTGRFLIVITAAAKAAEAKEYGYGERCWGARHAAILRAEPG